MIRKQWRNEKYNNIQGVTFEITKLLAPLIMSGNAAPMKMFWNHKTDKIIRDTKFSK